MATLQKPRVAPPALEPQGSLPSRDDLSDPLLAPTSTPPVRDRAPVKGLLAGAFHEQEQAGRAGTRPPRAPDPADLAAIQSLDRWISAEIQRAQRAHSPSGTGEMERSLQAVRGWQGNALSRHPGLPQALLQLAEVTLFPEYRKRAQMGQMGDANRLLFTTLLTVLDPGIIEQAGNAEVQTCIGTAGEYALALADPAAYTRVVTGLFARATAQLPGQGGSQSFSLDAVDPNMTDNGEPLMPNSRLFQSAVFDTFGPQMGRVLLARAVTALKDKAKSVLGQTPTGEPVQYMLTDSNNPLTEGFEGTSRYLQALGVLSPRYLRPTFPCPDSFEAVYRLKPAERAGIEEKIVAQLRCTPCLCISSVHQHALVIRRVYRDSTGKYHVQYFDPANQGAQDEALLAFIVGRVGAAGVKLVPLDL